MTHVSALPTFFPPTGAFTGFVPPHAVCAVLFLALVPIPIRAGTVVKASGTVIPSVVIILSARPIAIVRSRSRAIIPTRTVIWLFRSSIRLLIPFIHIMHGATLWVLRITSSLLYTFGRGPNTHQGVGHLHCFLERYVRVAHDFFAEFFIPHPDYEPIQDGFIPVSKFAQFGYGAQLVIKAT